MFSLSQRKYKKYEVHLLPDGEINYVQRKPLNDNRGPLGPMGESKLCNICGEITEFPKCNCSYYYNVKILSKEEFEEIFYEKERINIEFDHARRMATLLNSE